jgi:hypothetical protein
MTNHRARNSHLSNVRKMEPNDKRMSKRHKAAALQDLAEGAGRNPSRQRLGVRQPYAAFVIPTRTSSFHSSFGSSNLFRFSNFEFRIS